MNFLIKKIGHINYVPKTKEELATDKKKEIEDIRNKLAYYYSDEYKAAWRRNANNLIDAFGYGLEKMAFLKKNKGQENTDKITELTNLNGEIADKNLASSDTNYEAANKFNEAVDKFRESLPEADKNEASPFFNWQST